MDNNLTLRDAIEAFHLENSKLISETIIPDESKQFFNFHDIAHVVFDCDTSFRGEAIVKLWTIFGTTMGFRKHLEEYYDANAFGLFKRYSFIHVVKNIFKIILVAPVVIIRAKKMKKSWPWSLFDEYLDVPVKDIRLEFNIKPIATKS
jgi:ubiquinone biosynthesis protein Coq4